MVIGGDASFDLLRWMLKAGPEQIYAEASEQILVTDFAYLPARERCACRSPATDAHSRKIVGFRRDWRPTNNVGRGGTVVPAT